jgi:hypothetical protein
MMKINTVKVVIQNMAATCKLDIPVVSLLSLLLEYL